MPLATNPNCFTRNALKPLRCELKDQGYSVEFLRPGKGGNAAC